MLVGEGLAAQASLRCGKDLAEFFLIKVFYNGSISN